MGRINREESAAKRCYNGSARGAQARASALLTPPEWEGSMAKGKVTGGKAASNASRTLQSGSTGTRSKTAAGSALSQTGAPDKTTSAKAASAASSVLRDGRTSAASKSAAASALAQAGKKK